MQTKIEKIVSLRGMVRIMVFLFLLVLTGCAMTLYGWKATETKSFIVTGVDYDEAFSKAVKAATDIGFGIYSPDKNAGTFVTQKGLGYLEYTDIHFFLEKSAQGKITITLTIKSDSPEKATKDFVNAYSKYVNITP